MASILIIDDDPAIRRTLERLLSREGYMVETAQDGVEALAKLDAHRPDLVITDVYMPEMDGIELVLRIRERDETLPIVAISGGGNAPAQFVLEDARELGATAVLRKPFDAKQVLGVVRGALREDGGGAGA